MGVEGHQDSNGDSGREGGDGGDTDGVHPLTGDASHRLDGEPGKGQEGRKQWDAPAPEEPGVAALDPRVVAPRVGVGDSSGRAHPQQVVEVREELGPEVLSQVLQPADPARGQAARRAEAGEPTLDHRLQHQSGGEGRGEQGEHAPGELAGEQAHRPDHDEDRDQPRVLPGRQPSQDEQTSGGDQQWAALATPCQPGKRDGEVEGHDITGCDRGRQRRAPPVDVGETFDPGRRVVAGQEAGNAEQLERLDHGDAGDHRCRCH